MLFAVSLALDPKFGMNCFALSDTVEPCLLSHFTSNLKTYPVFFHKQSQNLPCLLSQTISKPTSSFTNNLKTYPVFFHKQSQNLPCLLSQSQNLPCLLSQTISKPTFSHNISHNSTVEILMLVLLSVTLACSFCSSPLSIL